MKYPLVLEMSELVAQRDSLQSIIDVRSPGEFAQDHIPGAVNCPVLDDAQRIAVGTLYKQVGAFEAKRLGAALVAQNIAHHLQHQLHDKPRDWQPMLYCWRGGNRSGAMAHILAKIGWPVLLLQGGYKEFRRHVIGALPLLAGSLQFRVICGTTGSGKSRLLHALQQQGAQVLDLEHLATHRGSVLGHLPHATQPGQKAFESRLWDILRRFDRRRPVYVEAESKKVGNLRVPESLMHSIRNGACLILQADQALRVQLLLQDYAHFIATPDALCQQLDFLRDQHGAHQIRQWQQMAHDQQWPQLVHALLRQHYDPSYLRSIERNFAAYAQAEHLHLQGLEATSMAQLASSIIAREAPHDAGFMR